MGHCQLLTMVRGLSACKVCDSQRWRRRTSQSWPHHTSLGGQKLADLGWCAGYHWVSLGSQSVRCVANLGGKWSHFDPCTVWRIPVVPLGSAVLTVKGLWVSATKEVQTFLLASQNLWGSPRKGCRYWGNSLRHEPAGSFHTKFHSFNHTKACSWEHCQALLGNNFALWLTPHCKN